MQFPALSDLAANQRLQSATSRISRRLRLSGEELTSGLRRDPFASAGDVGRLHAIESARLRSKRYLNSGNLASGRLDATAAALEVARSAGSSIGVDQLAAVERGDRAASRLYAAQARGAFGAVVASLNTRFAGRALFSGSAVGVTALAPAEEILADIAALTSLSTTAADAIAAVDAYFRDPAGGYSTIAYQGSDQDAPEAEIGRDQLLTFPIRADADAPRDLLRALSLSVVAVEGSFGGSDADAMALLSASARSTVDATAEFQQLLAEVGISQARVETAKTRAIAESSALDLARAAIVAKDPYEAASEFQAVETQLQSMFMVTARLSRLTLTSFLR